MIKEFFLVILCMILLIGTYLGFIGLTIEALEKEQKWRHERHCKYYPEITRNCP